MAIFIGMKCIEFTIQLKKKKKKVNARNFQKDSRARVEKRRASASHFLTNKSKLDLGIITVNPPRVWPVFTLPTRGSKLYILPN